MENLSSVQDVFSLLHQEPTEWTLFPNLLVFAVAAFFGQLLIDYAFETFLDKGLVFNLQVRKIPSSGTPLQTLRFKDYAFISFNRVTSCTSFVHSHRIVNIMASFVHSSVRISPPVVRVDLRESELGLGYAVSVEHLGKLPAVLRAL